MIALSEMTPDPSHGARVRPGPCTAAATPFATLCGVTHGRRVDAASVSRHAVAVGIARDQRLQSPYKGFRCAQRVRHGGWSCSEFGRQSVLRFGVIRFVALQRRRFVRCAQAHAILQAMAENGGARFKDFPWRACVTRRRVESVSDCRCPSFF